MTLKSCCSCLPKSSQSSVPRWNDQPDTCSGFGLVFFRPREAGKLIAVETQPLKNVACPGLAPWPTKPPPQPALNLQVSQKVLRREEGQLAKGERIALKGKDQGGAAPRAEEEGNELGTKEFSN